MLQFSLLGSGSDGNAAFIKSRHAKILIDNGLSFKQLQARAAAVGASLEGLDAVFITHEHGDHVSGVGTLARKLDVPVFITEDTYKSLSPSIGALPRVEIFEAGDTLRVKDMDVGSFSISHDAVDPVSFTVASESAKLGIATDVGHVSQLVRHKLSCCHALVLESNYCPQMLTSGDYPPKVKQRILGNQGHMSNHDMCALLKNLLHDALQLVVLVHVSQRNNSPERALEGAQHVLRGRNTLLHLAQQAAPTQLFQVHT